MLRTSAFSLLELMIALAAAAVVAAFALPSWHAQMARAHRADAVSTLYRAAQFVETQTAGYTGPLPTGLDQAPPSGTPVYRLQRLGGDESNGGYTLEARPAESGPMRDDPCGTFALDATGRRANSPAAGVPVDVCWGMR